MSDPTTESLERMAELYFQMSELATRLTTENAILEARVRALESQLAMTQLVDPEAHEVYREAAVMMATYVAGAPGSQDPAQRRRVNDMWGSLADRVEEHLKKETEH